MTKKINPIRETDDEARELSRRLVEQASYGVLAVNEPDTGYPLASRVAVAHHSETGIFFSASDLSIHSKCLKLDERCSLLLGEPGKGDGLAYPRITLVGNVTKVDREDPVRMKMHRHFLGRHPKAKLYIDFADFAFYVVECKKALLNGGFGKAFHLEGQDVEFLNIPKAQ